MRLLLSGLGLVLCCCSYKPVAQSNKAFEFFYQTEYWIELERELNADTVVAIKTNVSYEPSRGKIAVAFKESKHWYCFTIEERDNDWVRSDWNEMTSVDAHIIRSNFPSFLQEIQSDPAYSASGEYLSFLCVTPDERYEIGEFQFGNSRVNATRNFMDGTIWQFYSIINNLF